VPWVSGNRRWLALKGRYKMLKSKAYVALPELVFASLLLNPGALPSDTIFEPLGLVDEQTACW
jgi:hypothetical protein